MKKKKLFWCVLVYIYICVYVCVCVCVRVCVCVCICMNRLSLVPINQLIMQKQVCNMSMIQNGLAIQQMVSVYFDGISRHTKEVVYLYICIYIYTIIYIYTYMYIYMYIYILFSDKQNHFPPPLSSSMT